MKTLLFLLLLCTVAHAGRHGNGQNYYVSSTGSDGFVGTTDNAPWQTIGKVNSSVFPSGGAVRFLGGQSFTGSITLTTTTNPGPGFTVTSYGGSNATITQASNSGSCVTATDIASVAISNLTCTGTGVSTSTVDGILITNDLAGNVTLVGPTITGNTVSGYGANGIHVNGTTGLSGWSGITISNNTVHDTTGNGGNTTSCIKINSGPAYSIGAAHANATISGNLVFNCIGQAAQTNWTGSGIFVAQINTATMSLNVAHDSGSVGFGSAGIWTSDSANVTIKFNEVYNQSSATVADGDGFDCDGGVVNCIVEYNYAHGNHGACVLMFGYNDGFVASWSNSTARFNVCQNNVSGSNTAELYIDNSGGTFTGVQVYNNTVYNSVSGAAVLLGNSGGTLSSGNVANNILYGTAAGTLVSVGSHATAIALNGNDYFNSAKFTYNGTSYTTFATFKSGSGQETVNGGSTANPSLTSPGSGGTCYVSGTPAGPQPCPSAYTLQGGSPMLPNAGINLNSQFGISVGSQDYYGNSITAATLPIGANN